MVQYCFFLNEKSLQSQNKGLIKYSSGSSYKDLPCISCFYLNKALLILPSKLNKENSNILQN